MLTALILFQHTAARRRLVMEREALSIMGEFQHTAARRRLARLKARRRNSPVFQHTAARRRLAKTACLLIPACRCFNTQPPEGGWPALRHSDHSIFRFQHTAARRRLGPHLHLIRQDIGFNTQPPEGGWMASEGIPPICDCFNTQPPEGGWWY